MGQSSVGDLGQVQAQGFESLQGLEVDDAVVRNRLARELQVFQTVMAVEGLQIGDGLQAGPGQCGVFQSERLEPPDVLQFGNQFIGHVVPAKLQRAKPFAIRQPSHAGRLEKAAFQGEIAEVAVSASGSASPFR